MAGWSDVPRNLCGGIASAESRPSSLVSGDVGCGGFAMLWHSPFESAKRLPNPGSACQGDALAPGPEIERDLDRIAAPRQGHGARAVVADVPAAEALGFVELDEMPKASRRVRARELARSVVGRLPGVVLERHPGEHDLERVLALKIDRLSAGRLRERRAGRIERPGGRPRGTRAPRPLAETAPDGLAPPRPAEPRPRQ